MASTTTSEQAREIIDDEALVEEVTHFLTNDS